MVSSARLSAPSRRPLGRGAGRRCPPGRQARAGVPAPVSAASGGAGRARSWPWPQCRKRPEGPLSFTVPSCGAAPGRLPERPKGAVCKTVGFAFPGSNPGPATTCVNSPWPGFSRSCGLLLWALRGRAVSTGVRLFPAVHGHIADSVRAGPAGRRTACPPAAMVIPPGKGARQPAGGPSVTPGVPRCSPRYLRPVGTVSADFLLTCRTWCAPGIYLAGSVRGGGKRSKGAVTCTVPVMQQGNGSAGGLMWEDGSVPFPGPPSWSCPGALTAWPSPAPGLAGGRSSAPPARASGRLGSVA
jgi:hypothetical protein